MFPDFFPNVGNQIRGGNESNNDWNEPNAEAMGRLEHLDELIEPLVDNPDDKYKNSNSKPTNIFISIILCVGIICAIIILFGIIFFLIAHTYEVLVLYNIKRKITFSDGSIYIGKAKDSPPLLEDDPQPHGKGTLYYANDDIYEGRFVDGKKHGKGTMKWKDGRSYKGHWANGKRNGKGFYKFSDDDYEDGTFIDGEFSNGKVFYTYDNGDIYKGDLFNDMKYGRQKHGQGKYTIYKTKIVVEGTWRHDKYIENPEIDKIIPKLTHHQ